MNKQVIFGSSVTQNSTVNRNSSVISFSGRGLDGRTSFGLDDTLMSKNILLIGASGTGKTNTISFLLKKLNHIMSDDDVAIVFDTKGEYLANYYKEGDYIIGNSNAFRNDSYTWNLFEEILADGWDEADVLTNANELSTALFNGRGSETQPFFCNAAKDIFKGIVLHFIRQSKVNPANWSAKLNNYDLLRAFQSLKIQDYLSIFNHYSDMRYMLSYLGDGTSNQALGVMGELNSMLADYFIGILGQHKQNRSLSIRKMIRKKGGHKLFIEYDLSMGEVLAPVYRILVDQGLKEALGRKSSGHVYIIADEFKLLPKLQHIDDALNFGRSIGIRIVAGIQSIDQLYDIYGLERGNTLVGGFGNLFAFYVNDYSSRKYIEERFGNNLYAYGYTNIQHNTRVGHEREGKTIEDWELLNLGLGQAVIGLNREKPFLFQFDKYI